MLGGSQSQTIWFNTSLDNIKLFYVILCLFWGVPFNFNLGSQDEIPEEHYKDSTQILQMLLDHLTQWTSAVE